MRTEREIKEAVKSLKKDLAILKKVRNPDKVEDYVTTCMVAELNTLLWVLKT